ncbi:daptide-type RiPP [Streptomyces sp. LaBMicrA B280]|uniref:daptide-type RiPP n=1 Tax=Streptomyces sp. LaBMicrA B280 TaxID=3391001 RepID=UPI003BA3EDDD
MQEIEKTQPVLELGMQELEAMEAPGFWTGFSYGVAVSGTAAASAAVSVAASIAT